MIYNDIISISLPILCQAKTNGLLQTSRGRAHRPLCPWNLQQKLKLFKSERGHTKMQPKQQALGEGFTARVVHEDLPVDLSL